MLPSNLLIARARRGSISPVYAGLTGDNLEAAEKLVQAYKTHIGAKKSVLKEYVSELEDLGYDYRYIRGLSALLDRRSIFRSRAELNPVEVRRRVFELAGGENIPTSLEARARILEKAASELGLRIDEMESLLYADLDDELILESFNPIGAERLVKWYNLALTQTLLLHSTEVKFTTMGNWQQIFREVKRLGLIHEIWRGDGDRYWVKVDGPLSLFRLNRRYGTALARLIPPVIRGGGWMLEAKILRSSPTGYSRLMDFKINEREHGGLLGDEAQPEAMEIYDSGVERGFAQRFEALKTGWRLRREPEPIPVGGTVLIPDFSFEKDGAKIYMEIVGFWTPEYLKRKIEKLEMLKGLEMIVAVDMELACHRMDKLRETLHLIYFKDKIPLKPILLRLREAEERLKSKEVKKISREAIPMNLDKPVMSLEELAERMRVTKSALREFLRGEEIPGYKVLPEMLIREDKLREMWDSLKRRTVDGRLSLNEASRIIEELGGVKPTMILEALGCRVRWRGIDPDAAEVEAE
ncbi:MAG: DUF790 family protein [Candidatus Bathyarchaeia archaeon]